MANNDKSKWDYYFDLKIIEFLNTISFYKDKAENDKQIIDAINGQSGSS